MIHCAGVFLVKDDGSVLGQLRDDKPDILNPNSWGSVGGGMEKNDEDIYCAGARELEEETGYKIGPSELRFLFEDEHILENDLVIKRTFMWAFYDGKQEVLCKGEGQEIRFINPREFEDLKFADSYELYFRKASEKAFGRGIEIKK